MKLQLLSLITLSCLLISCGRPESKSKAYYETNPIAPEVMENLIENQSFWCTDKDQCLEGIGRMFALSTERTRPTIACSAILIAPDVVLTNSHCAYTGRGSLIKTCESLYFAFPNSMGTSQSARCAEIIWRDKRQHGAETYRKGDNDFALIKLDRELRITPLKFTKENLKTGTLVFPMVVDQMNGYQARLVKLECRVKGVADKYGVITLSNCPIIAGNSGSAVLNDQNQILGIVFASSNIGIRRSDEDLSTRQRGNSKGFAYTIEHLEKVLGRLLN